MISYGLFKLKGLYYLLSCTERIQTRGVTQTLGLPKGHLKCGHHAEREACLCLTSALTYLLP